MSDIECDLHKNPNTKPGVAPASKGFVKNLFKSEDERLIAKYLLDSNNEFRMRHPFVIEALLELIQPKLIEKLKAYDAECKKAQDKCCGA